MIRTQPGGTIQRRIDLVARDDGQVPSLAHELAHVVLADRFGGRRPPRWIDEGIAMMADAVDRQQLHRRDLHEAIRSGTALRLIEVLRLDDFASGRQVAPFYGQSLSLVRFLAERDEPARVVEFAEAALRHGYESTLRRYYGIDGVAALERQWLSRITDATAGIATPLASRVPGGRVPGE